MLKKIFRYTAQNKIIALIVAMYAVLMLSIVSWGIPSMDHPYNYHMDEWHQLQSIKNLVTQGSPNVEGSANGPIFHFLLSGIYLTPFIIFKIIDLNQISSLIMQGRLFEILRLNTLVFGCLSLFIFSLLIKKFFKISPVIPTILFIVTPLWLSLSNYFKYDIALVFWIIVSLFSLLKYGQKPTLKNYIVAGIFCSLALATKISALPLLAIYILSFFYFNKMKEYKHLLIGLLVFLGIFSIVGVPDLILQRGDYREYFYSNLVRDPIVFDNFILEYNPWWVYVLLKVFPLNFGYVFSGITILSLIYWFFKLFPNMFRMNVKTFKNEIFMIISMTIFIVSLIPLELGANGNRLLVLLPFFALFSGLFLAKIKRPILHLLLATLLIVQFYQSFTMVYIKWQSDPRQLSSNWILGNIPKGSVIGIQNIPIYQMLPDIIIKEFYSDKKNNIFKYRMVDGRSPLPEFIIVTNKEFDLYHLKKSEKKLLISKLIKENYKKIKEFRQSDVLYGLMGDEFDLYSSGIVPISTVTVYKRDNYPQN